MPIPKQIQDLAALALSDRVLTFTERRVIIEAATKEGIEEAEVNAYLDDALAERLRSYSKEDLKHCPRCGAQIPLISDQCPFCGESLQKDGPSPTPPPYISGADADAISRENLRTAAEQHNIKTCPDCGAPFPLVSNICTHCGHILHEQKDSILNVKSLIANIQQSIDELKSTPQPTMWQVLWYRRKLLFFFLATTLLAAAIKGIWFAENVSIVVALFILSAVLWIVAICIRNEGGMNNWFLGDLTVRGGKSPVRLADDQFYSAIHRQEKYAAQIETLYGNNKEAQSLLGELSSLTAKLKKDRDRNRNMLAISILGILAAILLTLFYSPSTKTLYAKQLDKYPEFYKLADCEYIVPKNQQQPVADSLAKYIAVSGDARLSLDIRPSDGQYIRFSDREAKVSLRVGGVRISSTGEKLDSAHSFLYRLALWDENYNQVGTEFGEIEAILHDDLYGTYDSLRNGSGGGYVEFVSGLIDISVDDGASIQNLSNAIQSIRSYTIY